MCENKSVLFLRLLEWGSICRLIIRTNRKIQSFHALTIRFHTELLINYQFNWNHKGLSRFNYSFKWVSWLRIYCANNVKLDRDYYTYYDIDILLKKRKLKSRAPWTKKYYDEKKFRSQSFRTVKLKWLSLKKLTSESYTCCSIHHLNLSFDSNK